MLHDHSEITLLIDDIRILIGRRVIKLKSPPDNVQEGFMRWMRFEPALYCLMGHNHIYYFESSFFKIEERFSVKN